MLGGKRSTRRARIEILKRRRMCYHGSWARKGGPRAIGMVVSTPKLCSCWMCGHRRRHEGPTIQERRAFQPD